MVSEDSFYLSIFEVLKGLPLDNLDAFDIFEIFDIFNCDSFILLALLSKGVLDRLGMLLLLVIDFLSA